MVIRRAMHDPVAWLLLLVAVTATVLTLAGVRAVMAADACREESHGLLIICGGGPDPLHLAIGALLTMAAWNLVAMRIARAGARPVRSPRR